MYKGETTSNSMFTSPGALKLIIDKTIYLTACNLFCSTLPVAKQAAPIAMSSRATSALEPFPHTAVTFTWNLVWKHIPFVYLENYTVCLSVKGTINSVSSEL